MRESGETPGRTSGPSLGSFWDSSRGSPCQQGASTVQGPGRGDPSPPLLGRRESGGRGGRHPGSASSIPDTEGGAVGAGTFLSSRRFWEIRDSYRAGLTPVLPLLPSPEPLLVPQGGPPPTAPPPTGRALHPQTLQPCDSIRIHLHPQLPHPPAPLSSLGPPDLLRPYPLPRTRSPPYTILFRSQTCLSPSGPPPADSLSHIHPQTGHPRSLSPSKPHSGPHTDAPSPGLPGPRATAPPAPGCSEREDPGCLPTLPPRVTPLMGPVPLRLSFRFLCCGVRLCTPPLSCA